MAIKKDREYRNAGTFEALDDYIVEGYASTFDPYEMYEYEGVKYYERIDRNAFDGADMSDVVFLRDHTGRVLARSRNGMVELSVDDHGLKQRTNLGLTEASREMYEDIKVGNYYKMSFSFVVAPDGDEYDKETHTRIIKRIKKLYDVSAVSFPANPGTDIGISARDYFNGVIEMEKAERLEAERRKLDIEKLKLKLRLVKGE